MNKIYIFLLTLLISFTFALMTVSAKYTADFLTLGSGARTLAMGGAGTATADDAFAPYWNPAGLGQLSRYELSFMHATLNELAAYDFVSYIHPIRKGRRVSGNHFPSTGAIGISWLRVGVDDIPITSLPVVSRPVGATNRPEVIGTFSNTDNAFLLASGWELPYLNRLSVQVGGTLKLLYRSGYRNTNAIGGGADVGLLISYPGAGAHPPKSIVPTSTSGLKTRTTFSVPKRYQKSHRIALGIQVADVFKTKLYWNTPPELEGGAPHTETLPQHLKIGVASTHAVGIFGSTLTLALDTYTQHGLELHAGAEYTLFDLLSLRIGLDTRNGIAQSRQLTAGVGLHLRFVTGAGAALDYAFANHPALGGSHRMSLRVRF